MSQAWQRWTPLSGVVFVALFIVGFLLQGNSPNSDDSNAKIVAYLTKSSNQHKVLISFLILLAAMLFLVGFFAALRSRLTQAEGGLGRLGNLAFGAGIASTVFLVTAVSLFSSVPITVNDTSKFVPDPQLFRLTSDLGYELWVASVVIAALAVWATAAVVLRTRTLPRWFGWFSVVVGVINLAGLLFFPIFLFWLWIVIASILLFLRPGIAAAQPSDALSATSH